VAHHPEPKTLMMESTMTRPTVSPQTILIFAPRDATERAVVVSLSRSAEAYARGGFITAGQDVRLPGVGAAGLTGPRLHAQSTFHWPDAGRPPL
jgi:hypothetical protein